MGKNIISQRRGRGSPRYRSPSHRFLAKAEYPRDNTPFRAKIKDLVNDPSRTAPLMVLDSPNGVFFLPAPLEVKVGDEISVGGSKELKSGDVAMLRDIPVGQMINNVEIKPNDGGKICRASGSFARVLEKTEKSVTIMLPSKKAKVLSPLCRGTIGVIAGGGRPEKPFVKAGKKFYATKARNKLWPRTSAVSMNAVDHPFGSGRGSHMGKPSTAPRFAPPGRKVGQIRARRTGRRKK